MGEGSYITLFSPSDVTAFYIMKYGGGGVIIITLFSPSDVTAFHRIVTPCDAQQKRDVEPMLNHCMLQHWLNVSCLLACTVMSIKKK